jgi:hypothetical protein
LLLPVAGEIFLLTLPFIERRYRKLALIVRLRDLSGVEKPAICQLRTVVSV